MIRIKFKRNADGNAVAFDLLKNNGYTTYRIRKEKIMGEGTLQKIRNNDFIEWKVIDTICKLANCSVNDIIDSIVVSGLNNCSIEDILSKLKYLPEEEIEQYLFDYNTKG